ncbi:hypothetical protein D9758_004139 [Tetrapyrgos nigripes]|uniref:Autophagy-related protein 29 n=1 Tax=Tetrapyrgos nigripes TaxID=182062 RepID=A0A8H5GUL7_9AGAR|nr:hypothetical protein D9758_004139 [Tetrapyrgos nigripes]
MPSPHNVRVVVQLPYNRPEQPLPDPVRIEWNDEKAEILWKVIERSRAIDSGGTDWKGLAAHLQVPLPYLLYRVHARYEEDLRGLRDIQGALSPSATQPTEEFPLTQSPVTGKPLNRLAGSSCLSSSGRTHTSNLRARLNSLGAKARKPSSSSTLTLQTPKKPPSLLKSASTGSDYENEDTDSDEEQMLREEEAERNAEEQEALDHKLQDLQRMITKESLGLVSMGRRKSKGKAVERGRLGMSNSLASPPQSMQSSFRRDTLSNHSRSTSQSVSSASSPQGSVPEIPSPPTDSMPHSPIGRHMSMSPPKSSSPPALSPRSAVGQSHRRYGHLQGSNHGSEASASSFSDLSDASLSASALESALLSNIHRNGSQTNLFTRSSAFARSRFGSARNSGH